MSLFSTDHSLHTDVSFRLFILYVFLLLISAFGSFLCIVLILLLRRYDVFHINFRTILWNMLACILVNNNVQVLRPLILLFQHISSLYGRRVFSEDGPEPSCLEMNALPVSFCAFLSFSGILLAVERLYATLNYQKYEFENLTPVLNRLFLLTWIGFGGSLLWNLTEFSFQNFDYLECTLTQIEKDPIKTHWHILFAVVFQAVFLLIFSIVVTVNREKQTVYIKHFYNSLSPRFQIGENIKATRLLVSITIWLFLSLILLLVHQFVEHSTFANTNGSWERAMFWNETSLLIMPICTIIMPMVIFCRSSVFMAKARVIVKDVLQNRLLGQEAMEPKKEAAP
ncbi:Serpentine receptor class alpha/beta-14 [Aphelenchoides besseyi]|nr:Serpentine receptor class alpha/beta-14 [Aphelenchoides besseyi]